MNKAITDRNSITDKIEMRRASRKLTHNDTEIKCEKDEKLVTSITQIIAEIVKSGDKTGKNVLS